MSRVIHSQEKDIKGKAEVSDLNKTKCHFYRISTSPSFALLISRVGVIDQRLEFTFHFDVSAAKQTGWFQAARDITVFQLPL